jgi:hypothetical protein
MWDFPEITTMNVVVCMGAWPVFPFHQEHDK